MTASVRSRGVADALRTVRAQVIDAKGWRLVAIASATGGLSTLAFAPFFLWPILFVTFPVLVWLIDGAVGGAKPARAAAVAAWWFGFGYFFFGLMWIGEAFLVEAEIFAWLLPFAITLLPAGMALYWGIAGAIASRFWENGPIGRVLVLAISLSLLEWLRGHLFTGFPWNVPGLALTYPLALMQSASVLGIYGLTLWAVALCALPLVVAAEPGPETLRDRLLKAVLLSGGPLLCMFTLGSWHLSMPASPSLAGIKVRLVQPSVPQRDKWRGEKQAAIFADHIDLSRRDRNGRVDDLAGITHLIWPEAAMPFGPLDHPEVLTAIGTLLSPAKVHLLAGALRQVYDESTDTRAAYNSLMVFGPSGGLTALYDKTHLVPFGEFLPFQSALEAIGLQSLTRQRGGFARGRSPKSLLDVTGLPPVGPLICYEAIFPGEIVESSQRPGLLVIVTNDGWFGNSFGPAQHFHQARVRAVEQGMTVLRSANNGISAIIDPEGRVQSSLPLDARGTIDGDVKSARNGTVYARFGDTVFLGNAVMFLLLILSLRVRKLVDD
jgi:apolipoprotein N-acyltransferase